MENSTRYPGVRAEPKFLRGPTSLESLSSGISRLSSYVTSNLPKRKVGFPPISPQDPHLQQFMSQQAAMSTQKPESVHSETEEMTFSSFEKIETNSLRISGLLLGYQGGFQVWDVSNPDNVHEICSIRENDASISITHMHVVANPQNDNDDRFADLRPLLAIVSQQDTSPDNEPVTHNDSSHTRVSSCSSLSGHAKTTLRLYSLKTHSYVEEVRDFDEEDETVKITSVKSNHRVIVLGCSTRTRSSLHVLSNLDLSRQNPLRDVYHDFTHGATFTLGTRFLAYATSTPVHNSDPSMSLRHGGINSAGIGVLNGEKDMKGAAKDIAKEMVNGVKSLSEFGYQTLSNYFNTQHPDTLTYMGNASSPLRAATAPTPTNGRLDIYDRAATGASKTSSKKAAPSGMIIIRDILKIPMGPSKSLAPSTIAHFRPHIHPITQLAFNPAGTLLISVSKQGHTFHVFSIMPSGGYLGNAAHLYSLSRGYTDAQVEDCRFSIDSTWCAVTTARGTTHIYAINPYGGSPEITGHVIGKVHNVEYHPLAVRRPNQVVSIGSAVRIKQRHPMPSSTETAMDESELANAMSAVTFSYPAQSPMVYPGMNAMTSISPPFKHNLNRPRLIATFLSTTKVPYLITNDANKNHHTHTPSHRHSTPSSGGAHNTTPMTSFRNQASNIGSMLSSFGSSMAGTPLSSYLPHQARQHAWTSSKDKASDTRLFEFDEEGPSLDDDASKMIDDETGYQDMYSFHPSGILTLHRCWMTKNVAKKKEHGRSVDKLELSIKEEDIAEWNVARSPEWDEVKIPLDIAHTRSDSASNVAVEDNEMPSEETATDVAQASQKHNKKRGRASKRKEESESEPGRAAGHQKQGSEAAAHKKRSIWLSNAEISTFTNMPEEPPLWTLSQFSFQTFATSVGKELTKTLEAGSIPATDTLVVRRDVPEPYSRRIDRVGKTKARLSSQMDDNLDDALAELEENISNAMETSFTPSPTSKMPLTASPSGVVRLSTSAGATLGGISPSGKGLSSPSLSFEDAYLISMGGAPGLETAYDGTDHITQHPKPRSALTESDLQRSSLIQFDDDHTADMYPSANDDDVIRFEESDSPPMNWNSQDNQDFSSPDGDNEMGYPADSIIGDAGGFHSSSD